MKRLIPLLCLISACSARVQAPDGESSKPSWLKSHPYRQGYYTGIGHSLKDGTGNYIQAAKKSALEDLASQIRVNVSSTSVLSFFERDLKVREEYEQIIKTSAADELEDFELTDAWEDGTNYWVYYELSIARYLQIKEEKKQNATSLAKDYYTKGLEAEKAGERLRAISFYFQGLRSMEKYLSDAIRVTVGDREILLGNELYASIQKLLDSIEVSVAPAQVNVNRRLAQSEIDLTARAFFRDGSPVAGLPLTAYFEKGEGEIFPDYKTDETGAARILITRIRSVDTEQRVRVKVNIDPLSDAAGSAVYALIAKTMNVPGASVLLKVQPPLVFLTAEEKSFGYAKPNEQIGNRLKNLLANKGFEFTSDRNAADLWFDVRANAEKGSVSGSIYITYLTGVIRVTAVKEDREIYATTLDRVKGYGLDYEKSSVDAYNKALESLEHERLEELLNTVLR